MSAPRLTTLAIKGLVTTPNEYGVYPEGSCSQIENLLARAANQWIAARDTQLVYTMPFTSWLFRKVIGVGPGSFVAFLATSNDSNWDSRLNGATSFNNTPPLSNGAFDSRYLTPFVARDRLYANSREGVVVFDTPTVGGSRFRPAGLPQLTYAGYSYAPAGAVLPSGVTFTYSAVLRRKTADGYVLTSPPSVPLRYSYGGAPSFRFHWWNQNDVQVGDEIELYRSAGISGAADVTDPGTSMRLVSTHVITAADFADWDAEVFDRQPTTAPLYETEGVEIYTSPYQDGSTGANLPPPTCKAAAQWGAYTFYGNITEDPSWVLDVPGGMVHDFYDASPIDPWARANGVGWRYVSGTSTNGSPTVTGISAADIVGLSPGQSFSGTGLASGSRIVSVGATSVTLTLNATASGSATYVAQDILELNGYEIFVSGYLDFLEVAGGTAFDLAFYPSTTVPIAFPQHATGITILVRPKRSGITETLTLRATNGQNYSPPLPALNQPVKTITQTERPNVLRWSRMNQPEAVPSPNEAFVGSGQIIKLIPATDCLWILCTDGAYRLSGSAGVWRIDLVDRSFIPIGPDACCELNDVVYAYTPRGIASLSGTQVTLISKGVIDAEMYTQPFSADNRTHLWANPTTEELIIVREGSAFGESAQIFIYSTLYQQWSTYKPTADQLTAGGMYVPNDEDAAYPLFATYSSAFTARIYSWRSDAGSPLQTRLTFQPFYAGDPLVLKRWIDATWVILTDPNVYAYQLVQDGTDAGFAYFKSTPAGDARASMGIPRSAAIAPSLILGGILGHFSTTPLVLKGVSLRYLPLTTQQRSR